MVSVIVLVLVLRALVPWVKLVVPIQGFVLVLVQVCGSLVLVYNSE